MTFLPARLNRPDASTTAVRGDLVHRREETPPVGVLGVLIALTAVTLNHARVIGGINISAADVLLPLVVIVLAVQNRLLIPRGASIFVVVVMCLSLVTGAYISPLKYDFLPSASSVLGGLIKQSALLLYLIVGYSVAAVGGVLRFMKWFALGAVLSSALGIVVTVIPVPHLGPFMYYGEFRLQGFFDDPNYFALISVCALVVLVMHPDVGPGWKAGGSTVLFVGVLLSASKTGAIALAVIALLLIARWIRTRSKSAETPLLRISALMAAGALAAAAAVIFRREIEGLFATSFGLQRIALLFTDPASAIDDQGSTRGQTWTTAIHVFQENPVLGTGFGAYPQVAFRIDRYSGIAHNTYLQALADWGLPLAILFFAAIGYLLLRVGFGPRVAMQGVLFRNVMIVLLIGSFSISLNNVRLFWLLLGVSLYFVKLIPSSRDAYSRKG